LNLLERTAIKIVIDTNVWISFCIGSTLSQLKDAIIQDKVTLCFSRELFHEIFEVINRPKIQKFINPYKFQQVMTLLEKRVNFQYELEKIDVCRDPKDNFLLELSISSNANYLITGDIDLLELNPFRNTQIIASAEFASILKDILE